MPIDLIDADRLTIGRIDQDPFLGRYEAIEKAYRAGLAAGLGRAAQRVENGRLTARVAELEAENAELVRHQKEGWQRVYAEPAIKVFVERAERAEASEAEARAKIAEQLIEIGRLMQENAELRGTDEFGLKLHTTLQRAIKVEARVTELEAENARLQAQLDLLHGRKFSERNYTGMHASILKAEAERDEWKAKATVWNDPLGAASIAYQEQQRAEAELSALRADAERYRWLHSLPPEQLMNVQNTLWYWDRAKWGSVIDAAIDATREKP